MNRKRERTEQPGRHAEAGSPPSVRRGRIPTTLHKIADHSIHSATVLLIAALMLAPSGDAAARVGPPVQVSMLGEPRAAVTGVSFTGSLRIETAAQAEVSDFALQGDGWQVLGIAAPARAALAAGQDLIIDFEARPQDPRRPLVFQFRWNGRTITKSLNLSAERVQRVTAPALLVPVPERYRVPSPGIDRSQPVPDPRPSVSGGDAAGGAAPGSESWRDDPEDAPGSRSRDIHVYGRFAYMRSDYRILGGDGLTVRIMDEDPGIDDELGVTITNQQGYFDITVNWDQIESEPDIYVEFKARNSEADLQDDTWYITYGWYTPTHENFSGTSLDFGEVWPSVESEHGGVHILTDVVRTWRWYTNRGKDCSEVDIFWPDDDEGGSYYTPHPWCNIHIDTASTWRESTHSHEYGHHFVDDFADREDPEYCNPGGFCDDGDDCGHCVWCRENNYTTWSEGFAEYSGQVIPASYQATYGREAQFLTGVEDLETCFEDSTYHDPLLTEGFFAAALTDIDDDDFDDHAHYPNWTDKLAMGGEVILQCVDAHHPMSPLDFFYGFLADVPAVRYDLWETAANCGYDIDREPPDEISSIWSSHPIGYASPDNTITMGWLTPSDDAAGIAGYARSWTHTPSSPGGYQHIGNVTTDTSEELEPGTWYFNIRTHDRAGNWSDSYTTYGPMTIREPEPSDLRFYVHVGWERQVLPSSFNTNTIDHCVSSPTLPGNVAGTYWNAAGYNAGESATSATVYSRIFADEVGLGTANHGIIDAGEIFAALNRGPVTVPGGRHVFHCELDPWEEIPETIEYNNDWGHQWIWTPLVLTANNVVTRPAPENILAGWDHVHDGSTLFFNCDGLHIEGMAWWNSIVTWSVDPEDFYSTALYSPSTGAQNGFDSSLESSLRGAGKLNALIINQNEIGPEDWDIGVVNWSMLPTSGYKAVYLQSGTAIVGMTHTHDFDTEEYYTLKEFQVHSDETGWLSVTVETDPPFTPLHVQWRDKWTTYADLLDCAAETTTGADGRAHLEFEVSDAGYNSLVFFRDPMDGSDPLTITYRIDETPPDFTPYTPAGWHAPAVPRPAADGTPTSVPLPDTLYGNVASTYFNYALRNESPSDGSDLDVFISIDGARNAVFHYTSFPAYATSRYNWTTARTIGGGRHVFSQVIDPDLEVEEISDANNVYGEQYCWSPMVLTNGQVQAVAVPPPERSGGWDEVRSGEPLFFNCHGFRMATHSGWWSAFAVMPGDTSNVDVRLHEALSGVKDGFAGNLAYSGWSAGRSDYVLVNFNQVARHVYDVGTLKIAGGEWYTTHFARESYLAANPSGTYGPFEIAGGQIVALHETYLQEGQWVVRLVDDGGNVDFGICLHRSDLAYQTKSITVPDGAAWENEAGTDEEIVVQILDPGYYCLAVWKAVREDLLEVGSYRLSYSNDPSLVAGSSAIPVVTALGPCFPNPFHPRTTLAYDLAAPVAVELSIYDLSGARVRTLHRGLLPAGRYRETWDGTDDQGRRVAGGVYLARFAAGEVRETRKLTLLR